MVSRPGQCRRDAINQATPSIMKIRICTLSALALASSLALAQDKPAAPHQGGGKHPQMNPEEIFKKLDTNGDGVLSLDEFKAGPVGKKDPAKAEEIYKKMDTKGDGKVTLEEFKAHRPPHPPGGPHKGGPGKDAPAAPPPAAAPAPAAE